MGFCILCFEYRQVNKVYNNQGRIVDLVFCNDQNNVKVSKSISPLTKVNNYQKQLEIEFMIHVDSFNPDEHESEF